MNCKCGCKRLSACALGISLGILSGLVMMLIALAAMKWNYAMPVIGQWAAVFPGYNATVEGSFFGLAWGFLEGFVFGLVLGWIYNLCLCCCSKRCCCCSSSDTSCKPSM